MACIVCKREFIAPSHKERTCSEDCRVENKRNIKNEWYHRNKHKAKEYQEENKLRIRQKAADYRKLNREELQERRRLYRENNREKLRNKAREYVKGSHDVRKTYHLKKHFNMTLEDYNDLLKDQNYSCRICLTHESSFTKKLAVDHCHQTGKIRGLLCDTCNRSLGMLKDSVENLQRAIDYLKKARESSLTNSPNHDTIEDLETA